MKRFFSVVLVLALMLTLFACGKGVDTDATIEGEIEVTNENSAFMQYSLFDGERTYPVHAENPIEMHITVKTTGGVLSVKIGKAGEDAIYEGNIDIDADFTVNLKESGEYTISLQAQKHAGSYNFEWTEMDVDDMTSTLPALTTTTQPEQTTEPLQEATLSVAFSDVGSVQYKDGGDSDYASKLVLFTNNRVLDLKYLSIKVDVDEDGNMVCTDSEELFCRTDLTPGAPFTLQMTFEGDIPTRAVSYVDGCGQTHLYALTLSGESGNPMLWAF